ncbi:unnamed protein product [Calypogeia fissa]
MFDLFLYCVLPSFSWLRRRKPDEAMKEIRQACFDYLSLGGVFSSSPVALLSGLNPQRLSLLTHFFAVVLFGVGRLMLPFPSLRGMGIN